MALEETLRYHGYGSDCDPPATVGQAARVGDFRRLKELIENGQPVDVADNRGWRPTHEAAYSNHYECLSLLLQQGATFVGWQSFEGYSALLLAAEQGHRECVEMLLQHGADPNQKDSMDNSPLLAAVKTRSLPLVQLLLEKGADINTQLYCGTSPLHQAASEGLTDIVKYLLDREANLDIKEEYGIIPIFSAAQFGHTECLRLMLDKSVETGQVYLVNAAADDGATPMFLAAQEGYTACIRLLLEYYADPNLFTTEPKALPLHAATQFNHIKCIELLLPVTDPEIVSECDVSPFYFSITHADAVCTKYLCENGLSSNTRHKMLHDDEYEPKILRYFQNNVRFSKRVSALAMVALYEGQISNAKVLLEAGSHLNPQTKYEVAPLLPALDTFNIELAELLIAHGACVNLYHPMIKGNLAVVICMHNWKGLKLLLKCGAEVKSLFSKDDNVHFGRTSSYSRIEEIEDDMSTGEDDDYENEFGVASSSVPISFWRIMAEARYVMSRAGVKVGHVLNKLLMFTGSVYLDPRLLSYLDSEGEAKSLQLQVASPRKLTHLCRLVIRQCLSPQQLLNEGCVKALPLPVTVVDYLLYSDW